MEFKSILIILIIAQALISAFLSMDVAEKKGYSSGSWFAVGFFFGIFGLIAAAGLPVNIRGSKNELLKTCPDCAELIKMKANVCRYCGKKFDRSETESMIVDHLNNGDVASKFKAIDILAESKDDSSVKILVDFLGKIETVAKDYQTRTELTDRTISAIGEIGPKSVLIELTAILAKTEQDSIKKNIIKLFVVSKADSTLPAIIDCLKISFLSTEAQEAIESFGVKALPYLNEALESSTEKKLIGKIIKKIESKKG